MRRQHGWAPRVPAFAAALTAVAFAGAAAQAPVRPQGTGRTAIDPTAVGHYALDLHSIRAETPFYNGLGDREAVAFSYMVCDLGAPDRCAPGAVAFVIHDNETVTPASGDGKSARMLALGPVAGPVRIDWTMRIAHPQKMNNIRQAMRVLADVQGAALETIGTAQGNEALVVVGKFMQKQKAARAIGDFYTELVKALGTVACVGGDPFSYAWSDSRTFTKQELSGRANSVFKLASLHRGAQRETCAREIVYDPINVRVVKVMP